jgi:hypothetical protein
MKPNYGKLPPEVRSQLEAIEKEQPAYKQLTYLSDMADILQELLFVVDSTRGEQDKHLKGVGALLTDTREQLLALNSKDTPDQASPVVEAVRDLSIAMAKEIGKLEFNPSINVEAPVIPKITVPTPQVSVAAPDLSSIEKLLKAELPKAFHQAVAAFPTTDNGAVLAVLQTVNEWLESIDHASRMKPTFPNQMAVTGVVEATSPAMTPMIDPVTTPGFTYIGSALPGSSVASPVWSILRFDTSSGLVGSWAGGSASFTNVWDNRAILSYS